MQQQTLGFSTKRSTLLSASVTTTPYLVGSSTCSVQQSQTGFKPAADRGGLPAAQSSSVRHGIMVVK